MKKTKQISKPPHTHSKPSSSSSSHAKPHTPKKPQAKPLTDEHGDPLIKNLSDFVTSIKIEYTSKPLYTGGRIVAGVKNLYASCNGEVVVYWVEGAQAVGRVGHAGEEIVNFCVCPQERYIVTFTQNCMLRVLHLESNKLLHSQKLPNTFLNDLQFSPDSRHLAIAAGPSIQIFTFQPQPHSLSQPQSYSQSQPQTLKRTHTYTPTGSKFPITKLEWHPLAEKLQIVSVDLERNIAVFDYVVNRVVALLKAGLGEGQDGGMGGGTEFCIAGNGEMLVVVNNLEVKFYDLRDLTLRHRFETQHYFQSLYALDNQIYLGGQQTQLYSFPLTPNLTQSHKLTHHKNSTDNGISKILQIGLPSTPSSRLLILSTQQNITVLRPEKNKNKNGIKLEFQGIVVGFNDQIIDIKNSKLEGQGEDGERYFVIVTNSNNVKIMNKQTKRLEYLIKGHTNTVLCAEYWHPYLATAGKDNTLKLWRINDERREVELLANYSGHSGDILGLAILARTKIIATVSEDLTIKLWPMCLEVQQKVQIKSAIRTAIAHQKSINAVRVSPNEDLLVTCSQDRTLKIFNTHLTPILTLQGHKRGVWDAAFHPVEKMLVSAGGDGMLKGWSLETGECLWSIGQGPALIRCAWIYYNQVVTGSLAGVVKIWDVRKQTSLSYDKHQGKIWALDVTKTNNSNLQIFTGATDSTLNIWHDNTLQLKSSIMQSHELEEQQKIFYTQHMAQKKYCEGAVIAFRAQYTKLFFQAVERCGMGLGVQGQGQGVADAGVDFDVDGRLMVCQSEEGNGVSEEEFQAMVQQLKEIDLTRLLLNLQSMTSTVKLYKISNRILLQLLKTTPFSQLTSLNSSFFLPSSSSQTQDLNQFNEKKSGFTKWLESMIGYEQRHLVRLQKYIRGTHWIQHLYRIQQPFSA